jgi:rhamnose utilization protein RhaD (predicted bifunctional aldolase and dehydrogenase)
MDDGLAILRARSAIWGRDPTLVQGAGGNVSLKIDDTLWIKASGTWLADADRQDILVPVALPLADPPRVKDGHRTALRPSIETSLHAALPHRVVVHVHSVDAIAHAVRSDAPAILTQLLSGLSWALVPYRKPGLELAAAVRDAYVATKAEIFVLANHGIVIGADDVDMAENLLRGVVSRLEIAPRAVVQPSAKPRNVSVPGYRAVTDLRVAALAIDPASLAVALAGPLYPDHVVFLGAAPLVVGAYDEIAPALSRAQRGGHPPVRWIIVRHNAVLIADDALRGSEEMLRCLGDVAARLAPGTPLAPLATADIDALIDWDAERYRQAMATPAVATPTCAV